MQREEIQVADELVTGNDGDVVSLLEFKRHLRWQEDDSSEDFTMQRKLNAAIDDFRDFTGRPILTETWRMLFDKFFSRITLTKAPVTQASIVVKYYDSSNVLQTLSASEYKVINGGKYGMTSVEFDGNIPSVYDKPQAVYIEYEAGYTTVPDRIVAGVLEMASDYFEYRSSDTKRPLVPSAYRAWYPYKLMYHNL